MDFRLTDEQELLVDTARSLFTKECGSAVVRAVVEDPAAARPLFDRHLRDWVALGDGDLVDLVLFLVEAGAAVAPGPFLATAGLFVPLLRAVDHPLADAAAAGELTGTVAIAGPDGRWTPNHEPIRHQVIDPHLVDRVAVVLRSPFGAAVAVVDPARLDHTMVQTMDLARGVASITVPEAAALELAAEGGIVAAEPAAVEAAVERMVVAVAAEAVGTARWLLDAAVAYAKERVQFGTLIGTFQAVQHKLVDAALSYERAAAAVAYAAMCVDGDSPDRHRAVHVAKAEAGAAARRCAKDSMQVHAGIGYTWEHDLHLRLRRAYGDDALCGTGAWHLDRLADLLFEV